MPLFPQLNASRIREVYEHTRNGLFAEQTPQGHWVGELSTSALSTAVASSALAQVQQATSGLGDFEELVRGGMRWLVEHQNDDGGWGDTVVSFSNISTTMLCRAAFYLTNTADEHRDCLERVKRYLAPFHTIFTNAKEPLAEAIRHRYGKDRTFSVPILMTNALAGLVPWSEVPPLPFELACFPQSWFRALRLPVVSYALPALIAIGQAVFVHRGTWNPVAWLVRRLGKAKSLRVLESIQPDNGGFLEAAPLTSFVTLGLVSVGQVDHPVVRKCVDFLVDSVRSDGSWPIDTNLSTWVTTLSLNALGVEALTTLPQRKAISQWLLDQQYRVRHVYTGVDPGGWAWTPLPGGVPDADDTPGALLALANLAECDDEILALLKDAYDGKSIAAGLGWLLDLQNRDGGWPTFCRGWTNLPFDRSGSDLTAHVLRAFARWEQLRKQDPEVHTLLDGIDATQIQRATERGFAYLRRTQRDDGSWLPLWFGNQHASDDENPTYGTARVLAVYRDLQRMSDEPARRAIAWMVAAQNEDGGWGAGTGTPSSIEETALCLEVLLDADVSGDVLERGISWLLGEIERGGLERPTPIGFYFAKLWYFERLYPIIFSLAMLERLRRRLEV